MIETIATVTTDQPERYLKQLVNHLAHKLSTGFGDDGSGEIVLDVGSCRLVAQPGALEPKAYSAGADRSPLTLELPPKSVVVVTLKP